MRENLIKYHITPRILKADTVQKISVKGLDSSCRFLDGVDYTVTVTQKDGWEYEAGSDFKSSGRKCLSTYTVRSESGVLSFEHYFSGEGEWKINIARAENEKNIPEHLVKYGWKWKINELLTGFDFYVYSLREDLYRKRPYKGDLHIHTCLSDGNESPEMTAAQYRKYGFDFISVTDHFTMAPSLELIEKLKDVPTRITAFPGEEIHPIVGAQFHVVNIGAHESVNEIVQKNPEKVRREVEDIAAGINLPSATDRAEIAWYTWIYEKIRALGGICIYPHPFWTPRDAYSVRSKISGYILENKLCDVFEVLGGTDKRHNREQVALYIDMLSKGVDLPIVASSDSHSSTAPGRAHFCDNWTVAFAECRESIPECILNGMSVAVDNMTPSDKNVYGKLRLCDYTWFLLENYYPQRDELCMAAGHALLRYVQGDEAQIKLIELLEDEVKKFDDAFFAK